MDAAVPADSRSDSSSRWRLFGDRIPKSEVVFFVQVILIYIVVIVSIINISIGRQATVVGYSTDQLFGISYAKPYTQTEETAKWRTCT